MGGLTEPGGVDAGVGEVDDRPGAGLHLVEDQIGEAHLVLCLERVVPRLLVAHRTAPLMPASAGSCTADAADLCGDAQGGPHVGLPVGSCLQFAQSCDGLGAPGDGHLDDPAFSEHPQWHCRRLGAGSGNGGPGPGRTTEAGEGRPGRARRESPRPARAAAVRQRDRGAGWLARPRSPESAGASSPEAISVDTYSAETSRPLLQRGTAGAGLSGWIRPQDAGARPGSCAERGGRAYAVPPRRIRTGVRNVLAELHGQGAGQSRTADRLVVPHRLADSSAIPANSRASHGSRRWSQPCESSRPSRPRAP